MKMKIMIIVLLVGITILLVYPKAMLVVNSNNSIVKMPHDAAAQCEGCHINSEYSDLVPQADVILEHKNQSIACAGCHIDSLHPIHELVFEGDPDFCMYCHGDPPIIPTKSQDFIVCEDCHGFPDSYSPGYGNLIDIHIPRKIECIKCHAESFRSYHSKFID